MKAQAGIEVAEKNLETAQTTYGILDPSKK